MIIILYFNYLRNINNINVIILVFVKLCTKIGGCNSHNNAVKTN